MSNLVTLKRLGDIINFKRGYDLPVSDRTDGPYPVISSSGISGYHSEYKVEGEGLITGRYGTLGEVYYINGKYWPHNTTLYVTDFKGNYPKYVYYLLKCLGNLKTSDKSTVPGINRNDLHEVEVPFIKRELQESVANILSTIDSKITLNNRINAELEAMAKTIYNYWFVQFDFPDKKGKPYKASGGKMVWSEELKREMPEGWNSGVLSDVANITMGQSPPGESYNDNGDGTIFFQGSTDFGLRFPTIRQFTTQPGRMAKRGDILLSVRAPVGTMNIAMVECCIGRGLAALNSKDDCIAYLHGVMNNLHQIFERRNTDGTTFGAITKDDLFSLRVVRAPKEILEKFDAVTKPMFDKQNVMAEENQKLTELRDWLLPMLMNGQVKIKDAEGELAMAAEPKANYGRNK
jgi:type I restriction enzyme S subunit